MRLFMHAGCAWVGYGVAATTETFRKDLLGIFGPAVASEMSVLELGTLYGGTTAFLANAFGYVISVDRDVGFLRAARESIGKKQKNVAFFALDIYVDSWSQLLANDVDLVFIDAAHDYVSVMSYVGTYFTRR